MINDRRAEKNSIAVLADQIVTRAVLADLPRALGVECLEKDHRITAAELEETLRTEAVDVGEGDVLLIRTGKHAGTRQQELVGVHGFRPTRNRARGVTLGSRTKTCGDGHRFMGLRGLAQRVRDHVASSCSGDSSPGTTNR